jgi:hypothetical protein
LLSYIVGTLLVYYGSISEGISPASLELESTYLLLIIEKAVYNILRLIESSIVLGDLITLSLSSASLLLLLLEVLLGMT